MPSACRSRLARMCGMERSPSTCFLKDRGNDGAPDCSGLGLTLRTGPDSDLSLALSFDSDLGSAWDLDSDSGRGSAARPNIVRAIAYLECAAPTTTKGRKSLACKPCFLSSTCRCERFMAQRRASSVTLPPTSRRPRSRKSCSAWSPAARRASPTLAGGLASTVAAVAAVADVADVADVTLLPLLHSHHPAAHRAAPASAAVPASRERRAADA